MRLFESRDHKPGIVTVLISSGVETRPRFQWASDRVILYGQLRSREISYHSPSCEYIGAGSHLESNQLWNRTAILLTEPHVRTRLEDVDPVFGSCRKVYMTSAALCPGVAN